MKKSACSLTYLNAEKDREPLSKALKKIKGVKTVLTRSEAAKKYHPYAVAHWQPGGAADPVTVFGELENKTEEALPESYRAHGSEYERRIPLIILNTPALPPAGYFNYNKDLRAWLFDKNINRFRTAEIAAS